MNKAIPIIHESADEIKQMFNRERQPAKQQRLHALYLLASGQARRRTEVAALLSVDRNTVGRWLAQYEQGGLPALLAVYIPAGKPPPLSTEQVVHLQAVLQQPEGFASYEAVRQWIADHLGVHLTYNATRKLVRYKLGAKLKVARPSHQKKR